MQIPLFKSSWCVAGKVKEIVVVFKKRGCTIYNLENNGDIVGTAELATGEKGFGQLCTKTGNELLYFTKGNKVVSTEFKVFVYTGMRFDRFLADF